MCLNLQDNKLYTAKENITVYKRLNIVYLYPGDISELHGKTFTKVKDEEITGKFSVYANELYLCSDDSMLDGNVIENRFGYKYSYLFNLSITSLIVDGGEILVSKIVTPYRRFEVTIGETYKSDLICNEDNEVYIGIHSFEFLGDANMNYFSWEDIIYVECVIPKGAKYYKGLFNCWESYASDELTYMKIVE